MKGENSLGYFSLNSLRHISHSCLIVARVKDKNHNSKIINVKSEDILFNLRSL